MQYLLFLLSHPVTTLILSSSVIFQQALIKVGRDQNFIDKLHLFDRLSVNSEIVGETLPIGCTKKKKRIQPV